MHSNILERGCDLKRLYFCTQNYNMQAITQYACIVFAMPTEGMLIAHVQLSYNDCTREPACCS